MISHTVLKPRKVEFESDKPDVIGLVKNHREFGIFDCVTCVVESFQCTASVLNLNAARFVSMQAYSTSMSFSSLNTVYPTLAYGMLVKSLYDYYAKQGPVDERLKKEYVAVSLQSRQNEALIAKGYVYGGVRITALDWLSDEFLSTFDVSGLIP